MVNTNNEYNGFCISIASMANLEGYYIADVSTKCGKRLYGWELLNSLNCATVKATNFIDGMISRGIKP